MMNTEKSQNPKSGAELARVHAEFDHVMNTPSPNPRYNGITPLEVVRVLRKAARKPTKGINRVFSSILRDSRLLSLVALLVNVASAQPMDPAASYSPGFVWVQFAEGVAVSAGASKTGLAIFDQEAARFGVTDISKAFPFVDRVAERRELAESTKKLQRIYAVHHEESFDSRRVAAALARDPKVVYAEPRFVRESMWDLAGPEEHESLILDTPNDPLFREAPYMQRSRMPDAWDVVKGDQGDVVIAIVELGGIGVSHEDLRGTLWINPGEIPNNGVDDDANGFVDDVHGWDFRENSPIVPGFASSLGIQHGVAVSGAALAEADNGIGLAGTSWNAKFMPLVGSVSGVLYAALNGADVINASYGGPGYSNTAAQAMQAAVDEGALVVAAAGNSGVNSDQVPSYPANYPINLNVGGTLAGSDENYYNYGRSVSVFAAGRNVVVPVPGNAYGREFGTSFASPLVAGIAALVKTANPHFTPHQVREQVRLTADNIDAVNDASLAGLLGRGRVNAYRAVTESGFPAVRMTEYQLIGGERALQSGESAEVTARVTNYLADTENLTISWFSDGAFVEFDTGPISIGRLEMGESVEISSSFTLNENTPYRARFFVSPRARDGSYDDAADIVRLTANAGETLTHRTDAMGFTITSEGNLGFLDTRFRGVGRGVWMYDENNQERSILHEGSLVVATGPDAVSDGFFSSERRFLDPTQHMDLIPKKGAKLEIREPGQLVTQEGRMELVDSRAANPIGVAILQESFVDTAEENEDFVILRYTLTNPTGRTVENMHVGLMFRWRLNSFRTPDYVGFDGSRSFGFNQNAAANPNLLVGTLPLTATSPVHFRVLNDRAEMTDRTKWSFLTGGIHSPPSGADHWTQVTGLGPFTIDPGKEIQVAFAVVTGGSREDLFQNADNAKVLWESTIQQAPTAQFIQNVDGPAIDVYLDGQRIHDDWAFQSASDFEVLSVGEHTIDVVAGGENDNAQPLSSKTIAVTTSTDYHILAHGKGEDVNLVIVNDVRKSHSVEDQATFYVAHGARELDVVDVHLLQPGADEVVLLDNASYGASGQYVTVSPGLHDIEVTAAADGRLVNVFQFDLSGLAQQAFMLGLSGSGTSAREGLTMIGVLADGTILYPTAVTRTESPTELPHQFVLHSNYPNPFNPSTTILMDLPADAKVTVEVFDVLGRVVLRTMPQDLEAGRGRLIRIAAAALASGTYPYRVRATTATGTEVQIGQMTILK
ncbi:MAG: S8 family serine peptidase [Rhodothermaceae bacterium]|nr:S8 family serine peptidase [Rhodothermaceae bacterium]MYF39352.1 S8 family serine peptidase [Rhodothermaceae bacterium]